MTRSTPVRTMLPPNLTRHYYETRRQIAEGEGKQTTPWYQLTAEQKASVDGDVEILRRAIARAEEEQDLVAAINAAPAEQPAAATSTPAGDCECPGCTAYAALRALLQQARRLEAILGMDVDSNGYGVTVYGFEEPVTAEQQRTNQEQAVRDAIGRWVAAGKPLEPAAAVDALAWPYAPYIARTALRKDGLGESRFAAQRREYWAQWRVVPRGVTDFPR